MSDEDNATLMRMAREIFTPEELEEILLFEEENEIDMDFDDLFDDLGDELDDEQDAD